MDACLPRLSGSSQIPIFFSKHHRHWKLQSALVVHTAFKTESNAIKLAMIANLTALTQTCKRRAPSPRADGLSEMFGRGSGRAACVSSAKIFCRVWLHSCLHKLYLLVNHCTFNCVGSGLDSDAQATMGVRPCVTAKLPVLRPWFWNLILLNLAGASCYFIASLAGRVASILSLEATAAKSHVISKQRPSRK